MEKDKYLFECTELQLQEIEILQSIYSNTNEFFIEDEEAIFDARQYLECPDKTNEIKRKLGFVIKFNANIIQEATNCKKESNILEDSESNDYQLPLEFLCRLPSYYPLKSPPEVLVRCLKQNLNRKFTEELTNHLVKNHASECSILNIIEWVKDNIYRFLNQEDKAPDKSANNVSINSRMFIYSHHIYSANKRREIIQSAKHLSLNGFSMPGKPGIICVEGDANNVQQFWCKLRALQWQKLQIKDQQTQISETSEEFCKFKTFEEMSFTSSNNQNIDLGQLFSFLKEKNLNYIFSLYFGVEGKCSSSNNY